MEIVKCSKTELIKTELMPMVDSACKDILGNDYKKIVLFGSYARGDFSSDSDIDIAVFVRTMPILFTDFSIKTREQYGLFNWEISNDCFVSMLLMTDEESNDFRNSLLINEIKKDGIEYGTQ